MEGVVQNLVAEACAKHGNDSSALLPVLLELQERSGKHYVSREIAEEVARALEVTPGQVFEVVTYFAALSDKPRGKYLIQICESTACSVVGYNALLDWFKEELGLEVGQTDADGLFTLATTHCIGACDVAPAVRINNEVFGNLTREKVRELISERRAG
ncbi:MAG TPA: NAD(P)H-dependent oxidoreductase subunit E [Clostridiales bacterium]|jgi:NADH-quinone oxidoreductase subunit E|nr:NAD(P)H-dependent oxidoreductase subunit E [Clostridiales bacterium]